MALVLPASAAIWPEQFAGFERGAVKPVTLAERSLWVEYGYEDGEQAVYRKDSASWTATAFRLHDSTGAMSAYQWQRGVLAAGSASQVLHHGNYLLAFDGYAPAEAALLSLYQVLPRLEQSPLPALPGYLPRARLKPGSERYVLGPVGLEKFAPGLPVSSAAFHLGAEGQLGRYQTAAGEILLSVFSYPTPAMARERASEFQKTPGALVKRTGPLVAVVASPPSADDAERLLALVRYQATVAWSEYVPNPKDNIGTLILNIFILIGFLIVFGVVAGLAFGGIRAFTRNRTGRDPDALTTLHLLDR